jgi:hypothetical protein
MEGCLSIVIDKPFVARTTVQVQRDFAKCCLHRIRVHRGDVMCTVVETGGVVGQHQVEVVDV